MPDEPDPLENVLRLRGAGLRFGERTLWHGLDLDVVAGEFVAILGANGSGKSSLLKTILGQQPLSSGTAELLGEPISRGNRRIGYVPQQKLADDGIPLRGRDLVALGLDGHRWGFPFPTRRRRSSTDRLVAAVGAEHFACAPLARLSGGEQQRLRIGQALAGDPRLLLCDEPLLSLDLANQRMASQLIDQNRRSRRIGVLFVTHDINPILPMVDRVLYLGGGRFRIGKPAEVLRSEVLSDLYRARVDVIHAGGRIIVAGAPDADGVRPDDGHPHPVDDPAATRGGGTSR